MDLEKLKSITLEKIKTKDFKFSLEEQEIIKTNNEILLELLKAITEEDINNDIVNIINESIKKDLTDEIIMYLIPLTLTIKKIQEQREIKNGILNSYNSDNNTIKEYIQNKNYKIKKLKINENILNFLLDTKRYDLIVQAEPLKDFIKEETFKRILEEFPFNKYYLNPYNFYIQTEDNYIKYKNKEEYNQFLLKYKKILPFGCLAECLKEAENKEEIIELITKKIQDEDSNLEIYNPENVDQIFNLDTEIVRKLIKKALEKNNLSIFFTKYISYSNEIIDKIREKIENGYIIKNERIYNNALLNNKEFIKTLIKKGFITQAQDSPLFNELKEYTKELLKNNPHYIKSLEIREPQKLEDIISTMIENDNYNLKINENIILTETTSNIIINKITKLDTKELEKNKTLTELIINLKDLQKLYDKLVENNQIEKIIYLFKEKSNKIKEPLKDKENLKKQLNKSFYIANNFFELFKKNIVEDEEIREIFINISTTYIDKILNTIEKTKLEKLYDDTLFYQIEDYFIEKYNLNKDHLQKLNIKFGPTIIPYLTNIEIHEIINLEDKKFKKFIELFPQKEYTMNDTETIYDAFKQEEFSIENQEIKNIFPKIKTLLNQGNEEYIKLIKELNEAFDKKIIKEILEKYPEEKDLINENYFEIILEKIKSKNKRELEKYIDIIHLLSEHFIALKREEYRENYNIINELNIGFEYDEKEINSQIIREFIKEKDFQEEIKNYLKTMDKPLVEECINYYLNRSLEGAIYHEQIIKINIRNIIKAAKQIIKNYPEEKIEEYKELVLKENNLKKKHYKLDSNIDIYKILANIRIDILKNKLLDDENNEKYELLKKLITKYKLDTLPHNIDNLLNNEIFELECNLEDVSTFINHFYRIYEREKKKQQVKTLENISIINIFKYMDSYSAVSSVYSQILGSGNARLIREDPAPHNTLGTLSKQERLDYAVETTIKNFKRTEVNVPTFEEIIKINDKEIQVTLGNFTSPTLITQGERLGSCMRIAGVGETLFDYIFENGFTIEFTNPVTLDYISSISAFRGNEENKNTVFFNESRHSLFKNQCTNLELIELYKKVAQLLIEKSRTSNCPIDNVVIPRTRIMEEIEDDRVTLDIKNVKKGLPDFYTDVTPLVHVLATTSGADKFVKTTDNTNEIPIYKPAREKIIKGNNIKLIEKINRIHIINKIFNNENFRYVTPQVTKITYGIVGEDWYIYIDEYGNIEKEIIERDTRALDEYNNALEQIKEFLPQKEEQYAI